MEETHFKDFWFYKTYPISPLQPPTPQPRLYIQQSKTFPFIAHSVVLLVFKINFNTYWE